MDPPPVPAGANISTTVVATYIVANYNMGKCATVATSTLRFLVVLASIRGEASFVHLPRVLVPLRMWVTSKALDLGSLGGPFASIVSFSLISWCVVGEGILARLVGVFGRVGIHRLRHSPVRVVDSS